MTVKTVSTVDARAEFAELINSVAYGHERVVLTRRGKGLLALVPIEDLEILEQMEDQFDLQAIEKALAAPENQGERILWSELKKQLNLR